MLEYLLTLPPYLAWLIIVFVCLSLEIVIVPLNGFWLCFAASAFCTALFSLIVPANWVTQFMIFALFANGILVLWWFVLRKRRMLGTTSPELVFSEKNLVGYEGKVLEDMRSGRGRMIVYDTTWTIVADTDYPAKTAVQVTKVDGIMLHVEKKE